MTADKLGLFARFPSGWTNKIRIPGSHDWPDPLSCGAECLPILPLAAIRFAWLVKDVAIAPQQHFWLEFALSAVIAVDVGSLLMKHGERVRGSLLEIGGPEHLAKFRRRRRSSAI